MTHKSGAKWLRASALIALALVGSTVLSGFPISRMPYLLTGNQSWWPVSGGFAGNVVMSLLSMALATALGTVGGLASLSRRRWVSATTAWFIKVLRNSPWLVLLYATLLLMPARLEVPWGAVSITPFWRAIIGLALPVAANLAEVVRGGVQSIDDGQWEAGRALGLKSSLVVLLIILPQSVRRMLPSWTNWYAILLMATSICSVVGVSEVMVSAHRVVQAEGDGSAVPVYVAVMIMFFCFCYPITRFSRHLERVISG